MKIVSEIKLEDVYLDDGWNDTVADLVRSTVLAEIKCQVRRNAKEDASLQKLIRKHGEALIEAMEKETRK